MENFGSDDLVKELSQGRELANQLLIHFNYDRSSSSNETRDFLIQQILSSYDNALSALRHSRYGGGAAPPPPPATSDSPLSLAGSPHRSDDSDDQDFNDQPSKKKKASSAITWTQKVKVCTETGNEGQLDDGYGWRKYGQKDILGAKYPRGYYRCTHRNGQGCLATKQVQSSNEDPTIFEITYRRKHTCNPRAYPTNTPSVPATMPDPQNEDPNPLTQNPQQIVGRPEQHGPLFNIQTSLRVITQDLGTNNNLNPSSFDPFNFPSSPTINFENNIQIFSDLNNNLGNYSHNLDLLSPATSGSDYFPISPNFPNLLPTSESELSPIVASMTSGTTSPTLGTRFPFGSNFFFGDPGYYP
ncbi:hypothetical protein ABFX02_06G024400 [Erythranthe guttata]